MKNTKENKARFFAQYWGQNVARETNYLNSPLINISSPLSLSTKEDYHLELKTLSQIKGKDAKEVAKILYTGSEISHDSSDEWHQRTVWFENDVVVTIFDDGSGFDLKDDSDPDKVINGTTLELYAYDYLRSKGYALPYMGISVEEQVKFGWVKL